MKAFFYASPLGSKFDNQLEAIYNEIEKLGYTNVSDETKTHKLRDLIDKLNKGDNAKAAEYKKTLENIIESVKSADICIFETSFQSLGTGYLVDKALDYSKPTIVLYCGEENKPHIFSILDEDKLILKSYTESTLKKILKQVLTIAREKRDKRFNFFLSPKLLNYLESASNDMGVTKSKLLRDMIVRHMRENTTMEEK